MKGQGPAGKAQGSKSRDRAPILPTWPPACCQPLPISKMAAGGADQKRAGNAVPGPVESGRPGRGRGRGTSVELKEQRRRGGGGAAARAEERLCRQGAGRGRAGRGEGARGGARAREARRGEAGRGGARRGGARARAAVGRGLLAGTCLVGSLPAAPSVFAAHVAGPAGPGLRARGPRGWRRSHADSGTEGLRREPGREGGKGPGRARGRCHLLPRRPERGGGGPEARRGAPAWPTPSPPRDHRSFPRPGERAELRGGRGAGSARGTAPPTRESPGTPSISESLSLGIPPPQGP
ncbi:spidroin-1-like [Bos mutus]|uniref:spidroin-1-like n=1 Tax=Bos mutus TaxID=72004 RepID=UPI0038B65C36